MKFRGLKKKRGGRPLYGGDLGVVLGRGRPLWGGSCCFWTLTTSKDRPTMRTSS
jgi:hypothetical protein